MNNQQLVNEANVNKQDKDSAMNGILGVISGSFVPILGVLAGSGLVNRNISRVNESRLDVT